MARFAELLRDKDKGDEVLRQTSTGWWGQRTVKVNTRDAFLAIASTTGVPLINDPWSTDLPTLKVVSRETKPWGGTDQATGEGGWSMIVVTYETPGFRGRLPSPTEAWTEIKPGTVDTTIYFDARYTKGATGDLKKKLNGGKGASVTRARFEAVVHTYPRSASDVPWARVLHLASVNAVNTKPLTLPRIAGFDGFAFEMGERQVRLVTPIVGQRGDAWEFSYSLALADDHRELEQLVDEKEEPLDQDPIERQLYVEEDLSGLW